MIDYILEASLENHQPITIMYQKGSEITKRKIRVIRLSDDGMEAYCYLRGQIRNFKKQNILSASF